MNKSGNYNIYSDWYESVNPTMNFTRLHLSRSKNILLQILHYSHTTNNVKTVTFITHKFPSGNFSPSNVITEWMMKLFTMKTN